MDRQELIGIFKRDFRFNVRLTISLWIVSNIAFAVMEYNAPTSLLYKTITTFIYVIINTAVCYGYYKVLKNKLSNVLKYIEDKKLWEKIEKVENNENQSI